jgi:putative Mg2+ transporter-C (MgtC) family protein
MISNLNIILRILAAAGLGAVIGFEQQRNNQPAGLRTHIVLAVGSTLAMVISINMSIQFLPTGTSGDPTRLAAQVVSGIGFLCAGAILRYGANIRGLATAASLWTVAMVGLAVGSGYYIPAVATTALLLFTLVMLTILENRFIHSYITRQVVVLAEDRPMLLEEVRHITLKYGKLVSNFRIEKNFRKKRARITAEVTFQEGETLEHLMEDLGQIAGVHVCKIT